MTEFCQFFAEYQDHLAPRLDVYEQAVYLYVARHTALQGKEEATIGFKSARKKMAFGTGKAGTAPSEGVIYEKLRSLESKGCIKVLSSERTGTRLRLIPPKAIPGVVPAEVPAVVVDIESVDFFATPELRRLILQRDEMQCFYCLAQLDDENHVIEHVVSRPKGDGSYRNLVAACRRCNNRKGAVSAEDFLRSLYREGLLSAEDLASRLSHLERLRLGELRPAFP